MIIDNFSMITHISVMDIIICVYIHMYVFTLKYMGAGKVRECYISARILFACGLEMQTFISWFYNGIKPVYSQAGACIGNSHKDVKGLHDVYFM